MFDIIYVQISLLYCDVWHFMCSNRVAVLWCLTFFMLKYPAVLWCLTFLVFKSCCCTVMFDIFYSQISLLYCHVWHTFYSTFQQVGSTDKHIDNQHQGSVKQSRTQRDLRHCVSVWGLGDGWSESVRGRSIVSESIREFLHNRYGVFWVHGIRVCVGVLVNARAVILRVRDEGRVKLTVCIDKYTNVSCWFFDCK